MIEVTRINPLEMSEQDKLDVIKFSKWDYNKRSAADIIESALKELFQIWRVSEGDERGILITKVLATARGGRTLYIEGIGGAGVMKKPKEMRDMIFKLARSGGCQSVTGWVQRPGMVKWLEEAELPLVASVFMREIPDVSQSPA